MKFQVPQFIEVEDKIFGPLTLRQFIYLVGGAGLSYILYTILPGFISFFLIPPVVIFAILLAFFKLNNKPFIFIVESYLKFIIGNKLYIWKKEEKKIERKTDEISTMSSSLLNVPKLSESKLKDLAWSLDIQEKVSQTIYSPEKKQLESRKGVSNTPFL